MSYSETILMPDGEQRFVTIEDDESAEAMDNDEQALREMFDPERVSICSIEPEPGEAKHLRFTVHAPTYCLTSETDTVGKLCSELSFDMVCYWGYPLQSVKVYYARDCFLASRNVFRSGAACIGDWKPFKSSMLTAAEKVVRDIVYDPSVTNTKSVANSLIEPWLDKKIAAGQFPTIDPRLLFAREDGAGPENADSPAPEDAPPAGRELLPPRRADALPAGRELLPPRRTDAPPAGRELLPPRRADT